MIEMAEMHTKAYGLRRDWPVLVRAGQLRGHTLKAHSRKEVS